jgi:hypothetical protein
VTPLLAHLDGASWTAIARSVRSELSARERTLVLGLDLEDACTADRARLLSGLPAPRRWAWRAVGGGRFRAAVVRLRAACALRDRRPPGRQRSTAAGRWRP